MNKNQNYFTCITKGFCISIISTITALSVFALLISFTNVGEETIEPVIKIIMAVSILLGSSICTKMIKCKSLINGSILGVLYMLTIYFISNQINNSNAFINYESIIMGIVCGMIGGIVGINK